jgi:large subunit ribosomal protein L11
VGRNGKEEVGCDREDPDPSRAATPAPPVGTASARTDQHHGLLQGVQRCDGEPGHHPGRDSIYEDRSFTFVTKTPPTPFLLRQAAGIEKGAANARIDKAGTVRAQVRQIAETKMPDLAVDIEGRDAPGRGHRAVDGMRTGDQQSPPAGKTTSVRRAAAGSRRASATR